MSQTEEQQKVEGTAVRRLTRRTDDKVVAGVASGLGHYFGIDPVLFRIGFVVLTLTGGVGLLLYAIAWIVLPESTGTTIADPPLHRLTGLPSWIGILMLVGGAALLASQVGPWQPSLVWGVVLIGLGVVLFRRETHPDGGTPSSKLAARPSAPGTEIVATGRMGQTGAVPAGDSAPQVVRTPRERSPLGWYTIGAVLVTVGTVAVFDQSGAIHLRFGQYFALALALLGIGLLIGAVFGRARLLLIPGLLLIPLVFLSSLIRVPLVGGFGERIYTPTSISELRSEYHLTAGDMTFDLSNIDLKNPVAIHATLGAGQMKVYVPNHVQVVARGRVGGGDIWILGKRASGLGLDESRSTAPSTTTLTLDLQVGLGRIYVYGQGVAGRVGHRTR